MLLPKSLPSIHQQQKELSPFHALVLRQLFFRSLQLFHIRGSKLHETGIATFPYFNLTLTEKNQ